jgi:anti-anti-sigma factor
VTRSTRISPARIRMRVQNGYDGRTVICRPIGDLDRFTFADFVAQISSLIHPNMRLMLDLSELGFIDATGLRALRAVTGRVRRRGGQVSVENPSAHVAKLLSLTSLASVIQVRRLPPGFISPRHPAS